MLRASIPSSVEFQNHVDDDGLILGNPTEIHQIAMNLCTNAAHAIVKSHGGAIQVESLPGQGTTVSVYFPCLDTKAPEEAVREVTFSMGNEHILSSF